MALQVAVTAADHLVALLVLLAAQWVAAAVAAVVVWLYIFKEKI
jgi:hypothetical protein